VLFVSHDLEAVGRLCRRVVWLEGGQVVADGPTADVVGRYLSAGIERGAVREYDATGTGPVRLRSVAVIDAHGAPSAVVSRDENFRIEARFVVSEPVAGLDCALYLSTLQGVRAIDEAWSDSGDGPLGVGEHTVTLEVPPLLNSGDYAVGVWIGSPYEHLRWDDSALVIHLAGDARGRGGRIVQAGLRLRCSTVAVGAGG
jgi:ABC-2 type transport system ATP-binding protein/lipopolysaccharide transport system ATP-binding protein